MIIDCVSDLHSHFPKLKGGDLLIVGGDLTERDTLDEHIQLENWVKVQEYSKKVVIAGNHDFTIFHGRIPQYCSFLCDTGSEFEGMKIWGSPWTKSFPGLNPHCAAFTVDTDNELAEKWALIPDDIDILVTHSPPYGILDNTEIGLHVGSRSLLEKINRSHIRLHVYGHIHESYGIRDICRGGITTTYVNASHVNVRGKLVNAPIRVIL